jgi:hypothetical protein
MRREWHIRLWLGALLVSALAGCAADGGLSSSMIGSEPYPPPGLSHRIASSHVELYWRCDRGEPGVMRVEGTARNPWYSQDVRYLEFDLFGVDRDDRTVSSAHSAAPNSMLGTNQITRFAVALRMTGREARYDLVYRYRFSEMEEMDARLAGPPMRPRLAQSLVQYMVRDACSDTQHLAR